MLGDLTGFDWNHARAFLKTAQLGSLSAAANALGLTQPTVGRQVSALEKSLGVPLFERGSNGLSLTPSGERLLSYVEDMDQAANQFSLIAQGHSKSLEGDICITASEAMAVYNLPQIIARLRGKHPGIQVELIASNETQDLKRREADIAVRSYRPLQDDLIGRKITTKRAHMYATQGYLSKTGQPQSTEDLKKMDFIGFDRDAAIIKHLLAEGIDVNKKNFPILASNHIVNWFLAKQGLGISFMPEDVGDADASVQRVLPEHIGFEYEVWLVSHRELRTNARVKTVFDFLHEELSTTLSES